MLALQFDPSGNISQDMPGFVKHPKLEDRMHCVALVQDASIVDAMQDLSPEVTKNVKEMQTVMNSLGKHPKKYINFITFEFVVTNY